MPVSAVRKLVNFGTAKELLRRVCQRLLAGDRARHGKACTTFGTTTGQNLAAFGGGHSFTEAVLVYSLAVRGLERSFHCL